MRYHNDSAPGDVDCEWYAVIWLVKPDGTRIAIGESTHVYRTTDGSGYQICTFDCPETDADPNDAVMVVVHQYVGGYHSYVNFITPQLNIDKLDAATWDIYLYTIRDYDPDNDTTLGSLRWAWDPYMMTRIENFSWTEYVVKEKIIARELPMIYYAKTPCELRSKISGVTITRTAQTYPHQLLKKGQAQELKSKWT